MRLPMSRLIVCLHANSLSQNETSRETRPALFEGNIHTEGQSSFLSHPTPGFSSLVFENREAIASIGCERWIEGEHMKANNSHGAYAQRALDRRRIHEGEQLSWRMCTVSIVSNAST